MRALRGLALVAGLIVLLVLVVRSGAHSVWESIRAVSPAQLALLCLIYGVSQALDTLGWRCAFARARVPFFRLLAARSAGEAVNAVTALGGVGGEPVKAWLISDEASKEESVASVIIAKTAITAAQLVLLFLGTALAVTTLDLDPLMVRAMLGLLMVESLAIGGLFAVQVTGVIGRSRRLLAAVGVPTAGVHMQGLDRALRHYYTKEWLRFLASVGWHFAGWLVSVVEAAYVLHLVGAWSSLSIAAVVEALGAGVRFLTFFIPASVGVLESANAAVFVALGFSASAGLAFTLLRRARQAIWVAAGILVLAAMRAGWLRAQWTRHLRPVRVTRQGRTRGRAASARAAGPRSRP
ncbi:MAG TPA: lysylphosphatidylglycerol synthase domain-containing protein [Methylomirabilota bacterium]